MPSVVFAGEANTLAAFAQSPAVTRCRGTENFRSLAGGSNGTRISRRRGSLGIAPLMARLGVDSQAESKSAAPADS